MSFADGLLHERQKEDEKKRKKVLKLIKRLKVVHFSKTGWRGDEFTGVLNKDLEEAIRQLTKYADGDHLI